MFRALALRRSESAEGLTLKTSAFIYYIGLLKKEEKIRGDFSINFSNFLYMLPVRRRKDYLAMISGNSYCKNYRYRYMYMYQLNSTLDFLFYNGDKD